MSGLKERKADYSDYSIPKKLMYIWNQLKTYEASFDGKLPPTPPMQNKEMLQSSCRNRSLDGIHGIDKSNQGTTGEWFFFHQGTTSKKFS